MADTDRRRALLLGLAIAPAGVAACATASASQPSQAQVLADLQARVDRNDSKFAIAEVLCRYARANDLSDEAMMRDCFWPESTHKHGRFDGTSTDFVTFAIRVVSALKYSAHHVSNVSIEVNGDRAFSECYYFAHHRRVIANSTQEEDAFFEGRYMDFHERRNGVWKIIRRRGISDFASAPVPANTPFANWPAGAHTEHGGVDEYYSMRQTFLNQH